MTEESLSRNRVRLFFQSGVDLNDLDVAGRIVHIKLAHCPLVSSILCTQNEAFRRCMDVLRFSSSQDYQIKKRLGPTPQKERNRWCVTVVPRSRLLFPGLKH